MIFSTPFGLGEFASAFTTLLLPATQFPLYMVLLSFALNMVINWLIFLLGDRIAAVLGKRMLKAISKVFNLLLAAIAVSMIIRGFELLGILHVGG